MSVTQIEQCSENIELWRELFDFVWQCGAIKSEVVKKKAKEGARFKDYFEYQKSIREIPSYSVLTLLEGQQASVLKISLVLEKSDQQKCLQKIQHAFGGEDQEACLKAWRNKLFFQLEVAVAVKLHREALQHKRTAHKAKKPVYTETAMGSALMAVMEQLKKT